MLMNLNIKDSYRVCINFKELGARYVVGLHQTVINKDIILKCREANFDDCLMLPISANDIGTKIINKLI